MFSASGSRPWTLRRRRLAEEAGASRRVPVASLPGRRPGRGSAQPAHQQRPDVLATRRCRWGPGGPRGELPGQRGVPLHQRGPRAPVAVPGGYHQGGPRACPPRCSGGAEADLRTWRAWPIGTYLLLGPSAAESPPGAGAGQGSRDPFRTADGRSWRPNGRSRAGLYGGGGLRLWYGRGGLRWPPRRVRCMASRLR